MAIDSNDFIDLFYAIKEYIRESNIELLENQDTYTCSDFVELCYAHIKNSNKAKVEIDNDEMDI